MVLTSSYLDREAFSTQPQLQASKKISVLLGESPDFSLSSRRVCKCCKRKVESVIKRTLILEQDKAFLIDKYQKNNSTSARQCARETAELSPPRFKRMCKESPFAVNKQAKSRKAIYKEKDGVEELGVFPLNTSFEDLKSAEFVSRDHSYADTSEPGWVRWQNFHLSRSCNKYSNLVDESFPMPGR